MPLVPLLDGLFWYTSTSLHSHALRARGESGSKYLNCRCPEQPAQPFGLGGWAFLESSSCENVTPPASHEAVHTAESPSNFKVPAPCSPSFSRGTRSRHLGKQAPFSQLVGQKGLVWSKCAQLQPRQAAAMSLNILEQAQMDPQPLQLVMCYYLEEPSVAGGFLQHCWTVLQTAMRKPTSDAETYVWCEKLQPDNACTSIALR